MRLTRDSSQVFGARSTTTSQSTLLINCSNGMTAACSVSLLKPSSRLSQSWTLATRLISSHVCSATVASASGNMPARTEAAIASPSTAWALRSGEGSSSGLQSRAAGTTVSNMTRPTCGGAKAVATATNPRALLGLAIGTSTSGLRPRSRTSSGSAPALDASTTRALRANRKRKSRPPARSQIRAIRPAEGTAMP